MPTVTAAQPANQPTSTPIVSNNADKIVAAGTYAFNTALVAGAPALNNLNPNINPSNAGGLAVSFIGDGVTTIVQALKMHSWFKQNTWAVWTCIALSILICFILYGLWLDNPEQGVLNALGSMYKAATNYAPLNKLGVLPAGKETKTS